MGISKKLHTLATRYGPPQLNRPLVALWKLFSHLFLYQRWGFK